MAGTTGANELLHEMLGKNHVRQDMYGSVRRLRNLFLEINVHDDLSDEEKDIKAVADQITAYLKDHEDVADTIDGIAQWWIMRQRLHEEKRKVEQAVNYLCKQGVVNKRQLPDGSVIYSASGKNGEGSSHE